jgi:hypothetical protein
MNNQYIYFPNLDLDLFLIKEIVIKNLNLSIPTLASHQRLVDNEPYLISVRKKYPFLNRMYNIYPTPANHKTPIHICPERGCAINIPIEYTEDSHTVFYKITGEQNLIRNQERIYDVIPGEVVELFRYTLDRPTLMNTKIPHGVFTGPLRTRIIMSWSITDDYETTKQLLSIY